MPGGDAAFPYGVTETTGQIVKSDAEMTRSSIGRPKNPLTGTVSTFGRRVLRTPVDNFNALSVGITRMPTHRPNKDRERRVGIRPRFRTITGSMTGVVAEIQLQVSGRSGTRLYYNFPKL